MNSFQYDIDNHLTAVNTTASLVTDPLGRLAAVNDLVGGAPGAGSRAFRYAGDQLLAEYGVAGAESGVMKARHVPGPGVDETVVTYSDATTTNRQWLLADERGSTIAYADASGAATVINTYDEYGVPAGGNAGRFQYTGQIWVAEAGVYHFKARDYSPTLGRFLQTDPMGYGAGMNLYAYVDADPLNLNDPTGLQGAEGTQVDPLVVMPLPKLAPCSGGSICDDVGIRGVQANIAANSGTGISPVTDVAGITVTAKSPQNNKAACVAANYARDEAALNSYLKQFEDAGARITRNVSFSDPETGVRAVADAVIGTGGGYPGPGGTEPLLVIDMKTGGGRFSPNQRVVYPAFGTPRTLIPVGLRALQAGFIPGLPVDVGQISFEAPRDKPC